MWRRTPRSTCTHHKATRYADPHRPKVSPHETRRQHGASACRRPGARFASSLGHMRLHSPPASSRRDVLAATNLLLAAASLLASGPLPEPALAATVKPELAIAAAAQSVSQPVTAAALLQLIPAMPFGAPATNETLPASQVSQIEAAALSLEGEFGGRNVIISDHNLNGSWRLLYSDGREISSLAAGFPGGFQLGPTYQPIDLATGRFENQGSVINRFGVARLSTCVVGDV